MRKLGLLAAAAGFAVCGSVAKADFTVSSSRLQNAVTVASGPSAGTYDVVTFTITNDGLNGTGPSGTITSIDAGLYAPTSISSGTGAGTYANNGMLIGTGSGGRGGVPTTTADVFATNFNTNVSWIADNTSPFTLTGTAGGSVLLLGANPTTTAGVDPSSQTFTQNQLVAGIAGAIFTSSGSQSATPPGVFFAQAVVPHGDPVELLNPVATGRTFEPNSGVFSPSEGGSFNATNLTAVSGPLVNAVTPEPTSLALFGIGAAGLLARRRRTA